MIHRGLLQCNAKITSDWTTEQWHMWSLHLYAVIGLMGHENITELDFNNTAMGDNGMDVLSYIMGQSVPRVRKLAVQNCSLTDTCVQHVGLLCGKNIETVDVRMNRLTNSGAIELMGVMKPEQLLLHGNAVNVMTLKGVCRPGTTIDVLSKMGEIEQVRKPSNEAPESMYPIVPSPELMFTVQHGDIVVRNKKISELLFWQISLFEAATCGIKMGGLDLSYGSVDMDFLKTVVLQKAQNLRMLSLAGCGLRWAHIKTLQPRVAILNLSDNGLDDAVPANLFGMSADGGKVQVLLLAGNAITDVSRLRGAGLLFLDVSYNKIATLPADMSIDSSRQNDKYGEAEIAATSKKLLEYYKADGRKMLAGN